ncbi:MAG TPA: cation:proton antiporter regulatory subunit [Acidimicrobiales bacterium]|jgi:TrkA domain protein|nr:cation:proton antiporter regulatory subunit [Acidimicrobiales bacterium]
MSEVRETRLPGVGVRLEFETEGGERVAVIAHRSGRRELVVYDRDDPDAAGTVVQLTTDDSRTLSELLGASQVSEVLTVMRQQVEGLAIEWLTLTEASPFKDATIAEGAFRTRTGTSIVAVLRGDTTIPAPGPEHRFEPHDTVVAVGTPEGLEQLRRLLLP